MALAHALVGTQADNGLIRRRRQHLVKGNTSRRTERVGKTPKQLLTGQAHPHWLELLGFQRLASA